MASNPISDALADLRKAVLPLVKGYLLQEAPQRLQTYYANYLQTETKPDARSKKTGQRYYSQPNTSSKLRTLYGNIQRALSPDGRFPGNITELDVKQNKVRLLSGIDFSAKVKAGKRQTTLMYARLHETGEYDPEPGTKRRTKKEGAGEFKKRPFLKPGFAEFRKKEMPKILEEIADELQRYYLGR
jgi:hypothetical protein